MTKERASFVAPVYLFLCLLLGGSAQAIWGNMLLQLLGLAILGWAALSRREERLNRSTYLLFLIALASVLVVAVQLIPLPASLWSHLGGRDRLASGYRLLNLAVPAHPASITPYRSLDCLLMLIPPLAILSSIAVLRAYRPIYLAAALLAGTVAGIMLGALQVGSAHRLSSEWYLYADTNFGSATGFFANVNHMATLLVIAVPFLAAVSARALTNRGRQVSGTLFMCAGAAIVVAVGIALNGSLAGYALSVPVALASIIILLRGNTRLRLSLLASSGLLIIGAVGVLANSGIGDNDLGLSTSVQSRQEIAATTLKALPHLLPWGSGLGSFPEIYHLYENHQTVTDTYVVHVHNDYLELALETGVPGILCILAFLVWWVVAVVRTWSSPIRDPFAHAASIASAAILVHSLVDFPLRTAAISACFGMCLGLLTREPTPEPPRAGDLRTPRHRNIR